MNNKKAEQLKEQGNECVKKEKYMEAVLHYSHGIQLDPNNHFLYSNRSLAFLKDQQYGLAFQDAKTAIKLQPNWPKGFFRKGEVESAAGQYSDAILSYNKAMVLDPTDGKIREAINKTKSALNKERKAYTRLPWKYTAAGAGIGLLIVLADNYLAKKPSIQYTVLQILLILVFGAIGYVFALAYRFLLSTQKSSLLDLPEDIFPEFNGQQSEESSPTEQSSGETSESARKHRKGGAGAARQRYKQGKS